ncbi:hypothetical protein LSAT2_028390 [Lamellibrachia satsuma]|nr:hypothetical protein LSAT2_028390 [Lamellibrachia satsuma]
MRIHEVPEHDNEDTTTIVMGVINSKMSFNPPLESSQLEGSHRVGPKLDQQDRVRSGPIIVRFKSDNKRDAVLKEGFRLKEHLARECRATLARECRVLKRTGKLNDCWTTSGNVMLKKKNYDFFPLNRALSLQQELDENEVRLESLVSQVSYLVNKTKEEEAAKEREEERLRQKAWAQQNRTGTSNQ